MTSRATHDNQRPMRRVIGLGLCLAALAAACSSAGPYGYSRTYTPLAEEEDAAQGAKEYDPVMAKRFPEEWRDKPVSIFGIVESRGQGAGGGTRLTLSVRTLATQNLCDEGGEETCRVTVSDREHAKSRPSSGRLPRSRPSESSSSYAPGTISARRAWVRVLWCA